MGVLQRSYDEMSRLMSEVAPADRVPCPDGFGPPMGRLAKFVSGPTLKGPAASSELIGDGQPRT